MTLFRGRVKPPPESKSADNILKKPQSTGKVVKTNLKILNEYAIEIFGNIPNRGTAILLRREGE